MPRPKWTLETLERACRKALLERTRIKVAALPAGFEADIEGAGSGGALRVRHDPHKSALIATAVHELLHDVLNDDVAERFDSDIEEAIVTALEGDLVDRIKYSKRRLAWWRRATSGKTVRTRKT